MASVCGTSAGYTAHFSGPSSDGIPCPPCQEARHRQHKQREFRKYREGLAAMEVAALGTHRRIHALNRLGWTNHEIGVRALPGATRPRSNVWQILQRDHVHIDTASAVDRVYRELSHQRGPSRQMERLAIRKKWPPPLAWDDIDNPEDMPQGMVWKELT